MKINLEAEKIYMAAEPIDFRKSIDGLCALVINDMRKEIGEGLYIFYNKYLNRIKILGWHKSGFLMVYKRLEKGKFFVRKKKGIVEINMQQLEWLLTGVDWELLSGLKCNYNNIFRIISEIFFIYIIF